MGTRTAEVMLQFGFCLGASISTFLFIAEVNSLVVYIVTEGLLSRLSLIDPVFWLWVLPLIIDGEMLSKPSSMGEIISARLEKVFWVPSKFIPPIQEESLDGSM